MSLSIEDPPADASWFAVSLLMVMVWSSLSQETSIKGQNGDHLLWWHEESLIHWYHAHNGVNLCVRMCMNMSEWVCERVSEWSSECVCEWVCEWSSEWVCVWVSVWLIEWMSVWVSECVCGGLAIWELFPIRLGQVRLSKPPNLHTHSHRCILLFYGFKESYYNMLNIQSKCYQRYVFPASPLRQRWRGWPWGCRRAASSCSTSSWSLRSPLQLWLAGDQRYKWLWDQRYKWLWDQRYKWLWVRGTSDYEIRGTSDYEIRGTSDYEIRGTSDYEIRGKGFNDSSPLEVIGGVYEIRFSVHEIRGTVFMRSEVYCLWDHRVSVYEIRGRQGKATLFI